jgi:dehydrogenase/reductase SDR family member 12
VNPFGRLLDASILFSFDRSGYRRHAKRFDPADLAQDLRGRVCLVTGANSGLGFSTAQGLAARGATVHMACRNAARGAAAQAAVIRETSNPGVHLQVVDVSESASIRRFAAAFEATKVDVLIHNAGLMPPTREHTADGLERTVATHLVGPHLLTDLLRPKLRGARVIWVSSGGMYGKRLDLDAMLDEDAEYDGVLAYARTKRAQVVLAELWAEALADGGTEVHSMHPGWAATPGVETSLPRFWRFMERRLRTPAEGADTTLWLAAVPKIPAPTGRFWFDRRAVATHLVAWTREDASERQRLWEFCQAAATPEVANGVIE